jgi:hypothetical protein
MPSVTPDKLSEIASLLERTSPDMAARLVTMFERMKVKGTQAVPTEALLQAVRESGLILDAERIHRTPGFDRLFWTPFESLIEAPLGGAVLPGSLPRQGLAACWTLITTAIVPDRYKALDPEVRLATLRGDDALAETLVAGFRGDLLQALDAGPGGRLLADAQKAQPVGARLHDLLAAHGALLALKRPLLTNLGDLCPEACSDLATQMIALEARSQHAAALFALLLMQRLKRPSQVFRVIRNVSRTADDRKLDGTEFAVLGHRLLAQARRDLTGLEEAASGRSGSSDPGFTGVGLAASIAHLADLATGLEREEILDAHGPWRVELLAIRKTLSDRATTVCQRASQLCQTVLPLDRLKVKGAGMLDCPRWHGRIDQGRLDLLCEHAAFLAQVRLHAASAGFAAAREKAEREIRTHIDTIANMLLNQRSKPDPALDPADLAAWRAALLAMMQAFDGPQAAGVFSRRLAA